MFVTEEQRQGQQLSMGVVGSQMEVCAVPPYYRHHRSSVDLISLGVVSYAV
jgi:hypothetical protein